MSIRCHGEDQFFETIERLVRQGLGFDACADTYIITLTGAY